MIKIAIADDHTILTSTLADYFSSKEEIKVVGCYSTSKETINRLHEDKPDVLLLDLSMPESGSENTFLITGLDVLQYIKEASLAVRVLILSNYDNYSLIKTALRKGAKGYLLKTEHPAVLERAIKTVLSGKSFFSSEIEKKLSYAEIEDSKDGKPMIVLSKREKQVLDYVSKGFTTADIAKALKLHKDTIAEYRNILLQKFQANNAPHMIRLALENNILKLD